MAFAKYDCSCDCSNGGWGYGSARGNCGCQGDAASRRPILGRLCGCTGCGELYWNEWFNDPPPLCDPCDACGNYTGSNCGGCPCANSCRCEVGAEMAESVGPPPLEVAQEAADPAGAE